MTYHPLINQKSSKEKKAPNKERFLCKMDAMDRENVWLSMFRTLKFLVLFLKNKIKSQWSKGRSNIKEIKIKGILIVKKETKEES